MPRKKKPEYVPPRIVTADTPKKRYPTKKIAERAAETQMLQFPGLELNVYQTENGGWYLTRRMKSDIQ